MDLVKPSARIAETPKHFEIAFPRLDNLVEFHIVIAMTSTRIKRNKELVKAFLEKSSLRTGFLLASRNAARVLPSWVSREEFLRFGTEKMDPVFLRALALGYSRSVRPQAALNAATAWTRDKLEATIQEVTDTPGMGEHFMAAEAYFAGVSFVGAISVREGGLFVPYNDVSSISEMGDACWREVILDVLALEAREDIRRAPLWQEGGEDEREDWEIIRSDWLDNGKTYSFWSRWYDGLIEPDGHDAIDAELLKRVALIDHEFWEKGADAVSEQIALIEEQITLLSETHTARQDLAAERAGAATRAKRSDNLPEGMEPLDVQWPDAEELKKTIDATESELKKRKPSRKRLRRAAALMAKAAGAILLYLGKKVDKIVDTALEEGTKEIIKKGSWVVSAGLVERIFNLSEMIMRFADKLPWP